ncbi:MAG: MFS transporter [Pseudochelatococcus sp.]|jgi:MFS family permease|uniref:MFS transporter n=1 Tax=Pseudochelatococcus sp. TaxID=2020869 RepID=UPI003D8E6207
MSNAQLPSDAAGPRVGDFVLYAAAHCISFGGTLMQKAAVGWLIWELTRSAAWVGAIALCDLVTAFWVAPLAGAATDRSNPYRLILSTQSASLASSLLLLAIVAADIATPWLLLAWAALNSSAQGFNQPVRMLVIGFIAPKGRTPQAIAANSMATNVARVVGPALGGIVMLHGGIEYAILLNALSFLPFMLVIVHIRRWISQPRAQVKDKPLLSDIASGFSYIRRTPEIALLFLLTATFAFMARPFTELFPAIAGETFGGGPEMLALLLTSQGVGALCGAGWMLRTRSPRALVITTFGAALGIAVALIAFALTSRPEYGLAAISFAGLFHVVCNIGMQSMVQTMSALHMRGRVLSLYGLFFRSGPAGGAFIIGVLAHWGSLQVLIGLFAAAFGVLVLAILPSVGRVYRLQRGEPDKGRDIAADAAEP